MVDTVAGGTLPRAHVCVAVNVNIINPDTCKKCKQSAQDHYQHEYFIHCSATMVSRAHTANNKLTGL